MNKRTIFSITFLVFTLVLMSGFAAKANAADWSIHNSAVGSKNQINVSTGSAMVTITVTTPPCCSLIPMPTSTPSATPSLVPSAITLSNNDATSESTITASTSAVVVNTASATATITDTSLDTGSVSATTAIKDLPDNSATISPTPPSGNGVVIQISNNDANPASAPATTTNNTTVMNSLTWVLTTGGNPASNTTGTVVIGTGEILASNAPVNGSLNNSMGNTNSSRHDRHSTPSGTTTSPNQPATTPTTSSSSSTNLWEGFSSLPFAGQFLIAVASNLLPATGNNWLFFALLSNVMMFLLGAYLRLHSGRSPGFALAIG